MPRSNPKNSNGANLGFEATLWAAAEVEDDEEPFEDKMARLTQQLEEQFAEGTRLERTICENLTTLGFGS
jgi:hypothetical protein